MSWEPIAITKKDAIDVEGDHVRLMWSLSRHPDADWAREFRDSTARGGSSAGFHPLPSPDVRLGGTIHWTVPATELRGAVEHVRACVARANESYAGLLRRRDAERRRRAEAEAAKAARLSAVRQALDALD